MDLQIWEVEADTFIKELSSGRTKPQVFNCVGRLCTSSGGRLNAGVKEQTGEFVVKICDGKEMTHRSRLCEIAAALLAQALDVPVIEPAVVYIPPALAVNLYEPQKSAVSKETDRHFGSKYLGAGWMIYPAGKVLEAELLPQALSIYCFDMLMQNPDRRVKRPNVLSHGDRLVVFDHDLSFSFLLAVGLRKEAWQVQHADFAQEHVFFKPLKGKNLDVRPFAEKLRTLNAAALNQISGAIPRDWQSTYTGAILAHVSAVRDNADKFVDEIERMLR